jgi:hypothetical protein
MRRNREWFNGYLTGMVVALILSHLWWWLALHG